MNILDGIKLFDLTSEVAVYPISVSSFGIGTYLVRLIADGKTAIHKIVVAE